MWKASRSFSEALLAATLIFPLGAWAGSQPTPVASTGAATQPLRESAGHLNRVSRDGARARERRVEYRRYEHSRGPHRRIARRAQQARPKKAVPVDELPTGAIAVSTQDLNRFVFAAPIVTGPIFPADAPVLGKPVYLDGNHQVLIQFLPGSEKPFEMIVELAGGQVRSYLLAPRPISGITYQASNIVPPQKAWTPPAAAADSAPAQQANVTLLQSVVMGEIPDAFYPTRLPAGARFDKFDIIPQESWSDGAGRRILIYALVSVHGRAAVVAAPEFYHRGMSAILLTGEVVDTTHSPTLYIIEGADRG